MTDDPVLPPPAPGPSVGRLVVQVILLVISAMSLLFGLCGLVSSHTWSGTADGMSIAVTAVSVLLLGLAIRGFRRL